MLFRTLLASDVARASDEDLCSQFNHLWSSLLLMGLGLVISLEQYVGNPIECLCPASMPEVHCNYTKALCWVKESYYTDEDNTASLGQVTKSESRVAYYPWAPWILFFMAAVLKLPHIVWYSFAGQSELDISKLVLLADLEGDFDSLAEVIRIWLIRTKRQYTDVFHKAKRVLSLVGLFWFGRHKRTFLTGLIILVKVLYLAVSVGLFFSLNLFLEVDFTGYGWEVIQDFLNDLPYVSSKFPRQIICNIKIRQMNNVNKFSIQCILPINIYNQKIFIFLWFWFIFLSFINAYSLMAWAYKLLSPYQRWRFVKHYVRIISHLDRQAKRLRRKRERGVNGKAIRTQPISNGGTVSMGERGLVLNLDRNVDNNAAGASASAAAASSWAAAAAADSITIRARRSSVRSATTEDTVTRPRPKRKKKKRQHTALSSIEMNEGQYNEAIVKRNVNEDTARMVKNLGHDGVLLFRTLESAVGIVIANEIFHSLYNQIMAGVHHSET